jgi:hydrogenase expression/formation protein HypD
VCVCPEEDIYDAISLSRRPDVIVVAFGDMLRVPTNGPKSVARSLEEAKAAGADIRPISSPAEALRIAEQNQDKSVVFFAAGFETTTAPVAAMLAQGVPENLTVLLSGRLTWPAVAMLLESEAPGFDGLIAPGHVSAVMGPEEWAFIPEKHNLPACVAGFDIESLLAALYSVLRQKIENRVFLDNSYRPVAHSGGNPTAKRIMNRVLRVDDANWRGIGVIPNSGYEIREDYARHDARKVHPVEHDPNRKRIGQMPPGCDCARVVLGKIYPNECKLFGRGCAPRNPVGPCMVSDEGACRIWWASGVRDGAGVTPVTENV